MQQRSRKLIGTVSIVAFVVVYAFISMMIAIAVLPGTSHTAQLIYYMIAGILWAFPVMPLIKWMNRSDERS